MRRMISLLLAVILILSAVWVSAAATETESTAQTTTESTTESTTAPEETTVPEDTGFITSDAGLDILKQYEGFLAKPEWDYSQYTVGYGTKCPDDMLEYYLEHGITEQEAEVLLRNHLIKVESALNSFVEKYELQWEQHQFDAMVLFSYNVGTAWIYDSNQNIHKSLVRGDTGNDLIHWLGRWCRAGGKVLTGLLKRRLSEANMYLNGVYSRTPPSNYCYVLYSGNGGTVSPESQCYDSDLTAVPLSSAAYDGYTFEGWYTHPAEGTQVTVLDASTKSATLYARWKDDQGEAPDNGQQEVNVTVTVTGSGVNIRTGPGTNYSRAGQVAKGDKLVITAIFTGTERLWGCFEEGWIALEYTDYEQVIAGPGDQDTTEPTEPEPTTPVEPEPPEPEEPETLIGTIKLSGYLYVRSGPGTGYSQVGKLYNGDKVEILEQQTVGSMIWGRISSGWISMKYVALDEPEADTPENDDAGSTTPPTETTPPADETPAEPAAVKGTVKAVGGLRVRTGPGISYSVADTLANGSKVEITEQQTVGSTTWGKVSKGWVSMAYIVIEEQSSGAGSGNSGSTGETVAPQKVTGTVNASPVLRVRSGPGTSYAVAAYLDNGAKVEILEQQTVGAVLWGRTEKGWVSMAYIVLDQPTVPQTMIKTITADCLRIRSSTSTSASVVGYLYQGSQVEILEVTTVNGITWGRVSTGWISMDYTA